MDLTGWYSSIDQPINEERDIRVDEVTEAEGQPPPPYQSVLEISDALMLVHNKARGPSLTGEIQLFPALFVFSGKVPSISALGGWLSRPATKSREICCIA